MVTPDGVYILTRWMTRIAASIIALTPAIEAWGEGGTTVLTVYGPDGVTQYDLGEC